MPVAAWVVGLVLVAVGTAERVDAAGVCGNGVLESGEECDPGGALYCNGSPAQGACTTGAQCGNGVNCYFSTSCCKFNCQFVGQGADCFDGNTCTLDDHCDFVGRCVGFFATDGTACEDGTFCNGADSCNGGECTGHAGDPCVGATDCQTTCDEGADACLSTPFVPCADDGNACTDDVCNGVGACTHPPLAAGTTCRAQAGVCDVAETCPGGGAACPADGFVPNGTGCGDACTTGGTCQSGACTGGVPLVCDDGDVCTGLETCNPATGCVAGTPLDCDDGDSCTADPCDPLAGCGHVVLADDTPCDDGNPCTGIDLCANGVCQAGPEFLVAETAKLGSKSSVYGDLAVASLGGVARLSRAVFVDDDTVVTADTVKLAALSSVDDVAANKLAKAPSAVIRGTTTTASVPLAGSCPMPAGSCGGPAVSVPFGQVVRIGPGSYGAVALGQRGTLELDPGTYEFCSLRGSSPTAIRPRGNVVVRIRGGLKLGRFSIVEPYAGTAEFWVASSARISTSSIIKASLRVPDSATIIGRYSTFEGSLCADVLRASRDVQLGCPLP